jgi:hypothetical protein
LAHHQQRRHRSGKQRKRQAGQRARLDHGQEDHRQSFALAAEVTERRVDGGQQDQIDQHLHAHAHVKWLRHNVPNSVTRAMAR